MPVRLNSGGPPMTVIDIVEPGRNGGIDVVAWWRAMDGKPQILEIDSRCVQPVGGGCDMMAEPADIPPPGWYWARVAFRGEVTPWAVVEVSERDGRRYVDQAGSDEGCAVAAWGPRLEPPGVTRVRQPVPAAHATVAPRRLFDLLVPTDPDAIGWSPGELLYAEPEIRAKTTHVVPLLPEPLENGAPRGLLAVLETPGRAHVSLVVVEWVTGPSTDGSMPALYQLLFHGEGPSGTLRELRHTHWGHADDGYLHEPNGALIAAAFEALKRWFDCWRRA